MKLKLKILYTILLITVFLISACDVYKTIYVQPSEEAEEVVVVPEEDIVIEDISEAEDIVSKIPETEVEEIVVVKEEVGEATVIIVDETKLISLVPKAEDPDKDQLIFTFTSPLDENGEWQTTYGDSGEYTITVTASDGKLTTSQDVLIIVNRKEEAPSIDRATPGGKVISIKETESAQFSIKASDLNNDELSYSWKLDGIEVSDEDSYRYETTFEDSGSHTVKVSVSDDSFTTEQLWSITISNVNRNPVLERLSDIEVKETETITIKPEAADPDGDEITFTISDPVGDDGVWETTYEDSGTYTITVTASDGEDEVSQKVIVTVENVNRPPKILEIIQK